MKSVSLICCYVRYVGMYQQNSEVRPSMGMTRRKFPVLMYAPHPFQILAMGLICSLMNLYIYNYVYDNILSQSK